MSKRKKTTQPNGEGVVSVPVESDLTSPDLAPAVVESLGEHAFDGPEPDAEPAEAARELLRVDALQRVGERALPLPAAAAVAVPLRVSVPVTPHLCGHGIASPFERSVIQSVAFGGLYFNARRCCVCVRKIANA